MEVMIYKGNPIIIGTGIFDCVRYFGYAEKEALKNWRKANGFERKHLKIVYVDKFDFGYIY